jgi:cell division protein ZapD
MVESSQSILYEIPLNERFRSLLRLEYLFKEVRRQLKQQHRSSHYYCIKQLFILLEYFERTDFKSELIKELDRNIKHFNELANSPDIDHKKLAIFLKQLSKLNAWFRGHQGKIGVQLLNQDFLFQAKNKLAHGLPRLSFDAPAVKAFLSLEPAFRLTKLQAWFEEFKAVQTSIDIILKLSRESGVFKQVESENGYFQIESEVNLNILAIKVPNQLDVYPEVSGSARRSSIQFKSLDEQLVSTTYQQFISFELALYN